MIRISKVLYYEEENYLRAIDISISFVYQLFNKIEYLFLLLSIYICEKEGARERIKREKV